MENIDYYREQKAIKEALAFLVGKGNKSDLISLLESGIKIDKDFSQLLIERACERNDDKIIKILVNYRKYPITQEEENIIRAWYNFHRSCDDFPSNLLTLLDDKKGDEKEEK